LKVGSLTTHLQRFILELGYGFCFVGRHYRLILGSKEYFVDLLFYHRFMAFDLKILAFEPEHAPDSPGHFYSRNPLAPHFEDRPVSVWKENIDPSA